MKRASLAIVMMVGCGGGGGGGDDPADANVAADALGPDAAPPPDALEPPCSAPRPVTGDADVDAFLAWFETEMAADDIPGGAFALIRNGEIEHEVVLGAKRAGECGAVTRDTLFRLELTTRVMSAAVVLNAVDQGEVSLDGAIQGYVPEFDAAGGAPEDVLLRHTLTMASGWPAFWEVPNCPTPGFEARAWWQAHQDRALWFPPGTMSSDEFHTIGLAALALENQRPPSTFEQIAVERVFTPLGMTTATFDTPTAMTRDHATGHINGVPQTNGDCPPLDASDHGFASIHDMALLTEEIVGGGVGVLGDQRVRMLESQAPAFFSDWGTTFGMLRIPWSPTTDAVAMDSWAEYAAVVVILPDQDIGLVILMNGLTSPAPYAIEAMNLIFGLPITAEATASDPGTWGEYAGTYVDPIGPAGFPRTIVVSFDGDQLFADLGGTVVEMTPVHWAPGAAGGVLDNFRFDYAGTPVAVRFWRDEAGVPAVLAGRGGNGGLGPPFFRQVP